MFENKKKWLINEIIETNEILREANSRWNFTNLEMQRATINFDKADNDVKIYNRFLKTLKDELEYVKSKEAEK